MPFPSHPTHSFVLYEKQGLCHSFLWTGAPGDHLTLASDETLLRVVAFTMRTRNWGELSRNHAFLRTELTHEVEQNLENHLRFTTLLGFAFTQGAGVSAYEGKAGRESEWAFHCRPTDQNPVWSFCRFERMCDAEQEQFDDSVLVPFLLPHGEFGELMEALLLRLSDRQLNGGTRSFPYLPLLSAAYRLGKSIASTARIPIAAH